MQSAISEKIAEVKDRHRADYLFDTKIAAAAVTCHPNRFADWFYRTKRKLKDLYIAQPGQTAAEMLGIIAEAEAERQQMAERIKE